MKDYEEILKEKLAAAYLSRKKKKARLLILMGSLTIALIASISVASYAWFAMFTAGSNLTTVTGDLNVNINKVTAYKYVYPFYQNSTDFIDYGAVGTVKGYVIEDSSIESPSTPVSSATITFALDIPEDPEEATTNDLISGTYTELSDDNASNKVMFHTEETFRYYLFGDETFTGVNTNPWSSATSLGFALRTTVSDTNSAVLSNVVIPAGAEFTLFDTANIGTGTACDYFKYSSITSNSCFELVNTFDEEDEDVMISSAIRCLKSGIYNFTVTGNASETAITSMTISTVSRSDNAIIANNMLDPTMIFLDYNGGHGPHEEGDDITDYLPEGINDQNTMVILDVELSFTNANPIEIGAKVIRERSELNPQIFDYDDTEHNLVGYQSEENRNALYASDFYSFSALFTDEAHAFASANDLWTAMHVEGDSKTEISTGVFEEDFVRFQMKDDVPNTESFEREISCNMRPKDGWSSESDESIVIPGSDPEALSKPVYHCYIGIEYDYIYTNYFLYTDRLGKTYPLDRDFGFHITATQWLRS